MTNVLRIVATVFALFSLSACVVAPVGPRAAYAARLCRASRTRHRRVLALWLAPLVMPRWRDERRHGHAQVAPIGAVVATEPVAVRVELADGVAAKLAQKAVTIAPAAAGQRTEENATRQVGLNKESERSA